MEIRDWSELTSVCLTNIFHRLSLEDRWRGAMMTCRSWLEAAKDPTLFSSFDLEPAFEAAGAGRPDTPFWWTPAFQRRIDAMLRSVSEIGAGGVREIRVRHCSDSSLGFAVERYVSVKISKKVYLSTNRVFFFFFCRFLDLVVILFKFFFALLSQQTYAPQPLDRINNSDQLAYKFMRDSF